jgi:hypothetical protein
MISEIITQSEILSEIIREVFSHQYIHHFTWLLLLFTRGTVHSQWSWGWVVYQLISIYSFSYFYLNSGNVLP